MSSNESVKVSNTSSRSGDRNMQFVFIILLIVFVISVITVLGANDPSIDSYGKRIHIHGAGGYLRKFAYTISHPIYEFGYKIIHLGKSSDSEYSSQGQMGGETESPDLDDD